MKNLIALFAMLIAVSTISYALETCQCTGTATFNATVYCCPTITSAVYTPDNNLGNFFPSRTYSLTPSHFAEFRLNGDYHAQYTFAETPDPNMVGNWNIKWDGPYGNHMYYNPLNFSTSYIFLKNDQVTGAIECTGTQEYQPMLKYTPTQITTGATLGTQTFTTTLTVTATV